jgi:hypothetical protein
MFVVVMVVGGNNGFLRQRMELEKVQWQVAMEKVLKQTIHGCFEALCTGRGQCQSQLCQRCGISPGMRYTAALRI